MKGMIAASNIFTLWALSETSVNVKCNGVFTVLRIVIFKKAANPQRPNVWPFPIGLLNHYTFVVQLISFYIQRLVCNKHMWQSESSKERLTVKPEAVM